MFCVDMGKPMKSRIPNTTAGTTSWNLPKGFFRLESVSIALTLIISESPDLDFIAARVNCNRHSIESENLGFDFEIPVKFAGVKNWKKGYVLLCD